MFVALARKDLPFDVGASLHKFIALAPCVMFRTEGKDEYYYEHGLYSFANVGANSLYGPTWDEDL